MRTAPVVRSTENSVFTTSRLTPGPARNHARNLVAFYAHHVTITSMNGSADYPDPQILDSTTSPEPTREEELTAALARSQADFVNYKRRMEAQLAANSHTVLAEHMRSLLPILDDVDRATQHEDLTEGSVKVLARFSAAFESLGLTRVVAVGIEFDPNFHEALSQEPSTEVEVDTVASVYQDGYLFADTLLRPARVHVLVAA